MIIVDHTEVTITLIMASICHIVMAMFIVDEYIQGITDEHTVDVFFLDYIKQREGFLVEEYPPGHFHYDSPVLQILSGCLAVFREEAGYVIHDNMLFNILHNDMVGAGENNQIFIN